MKAIKKHRYLVIMLLSILGLIIINTFGVFKVFVIGDSYNIFEFVFAFIITFQFLCFGVTFIGYEGTGTPINMLINGLFYFFLIAVIISFILFIINPSKQKNNSNK